MSILKKKMKEPTTGDNSLSIAHSVQKRNRIKMDNGGTVGEKFGYPGEKRDPNAPSAPSKVNLNAATDASNADPERKASMERGRAEARKREEEMAAQHTYAQGGEVRQSTAQAIMSKKRKMAEGGDVADIDSNNTEQADIYDDRDEAVLKENYDDQDFADMTQPSDSNEHGDILNDAEEDTKDIISTIRAKMRARRGV